MLGVYLVHFDSPLAHARHYCGWAKDIDTRFAEHASGRGARLTQVVFERGISMQLVRTWPGQGRKFERRLKGGSLTEHCPVCREEYLAKRRERDRARRNDIAGSKRQSATENAPRCSIKGTSQGCV